MVAKRESERQLYGGKGLDDGGGLEVKLQLTISQTTKGYISPVEPCMHIATQRLDATLHGADSAEANGEPQQLGEFL